MGLEAEADGWPVRCSPGMTGKEIGPVVRGRREKGSCSADTVRRCVRIVPGACAGPVTTSPASGINFRPRASTLAGASAMAAGVLLLRIVPPTPSRERRRSCGCSKIARRAVCPSGIRRMRDCFLTQWSRPLRCRKRCDPLTHSPAPSEIGERPRWWAGQKPDPADRTRPPLHRA